LVDAADEQVVAPVVGCKIEKLVTADAIRQLPLRSLPTFWTRAPMTSLGFWSDWRLTGNAVTMLYTEKAAARELGRCQRTLFRARGKVGWLGERVGPGDDRRSLRKVIAGR
jgi:hypothetical protein